MKEINEFESQEKMYIRKVLFDKLGFRPTGWVQAFTRKSYAVQWGGRDNEELEYIGDSVLNYYVVKILTDRFGGYDIDHDFRYHLTFHKIDQIKKQLVSNENLARIIDKWDFAQFLIVGKSDIQNKVDEQVKVKADLFEAILGAVAVQKKFDQDIIEKAVYNMLSMEDVINSIITMEHRIIDFDIDNAVTKLKECAEHGELSMPRYRFAGPEIFQYDKDGNPIWACRCNVDSLGMLLNVYANSKKDAKKAAAYLMLIQHYGCSNEYGPSRRSLNWSYKDGKLIPDQYLVCNSEYRNEGNEN